MQCEVRCTAAILSSLFAMQRGGHGSQFASLLSVPGLDVDVKRSVWLAQKCSNAVLSSSRFVVGLVFTSHQFVSQRHDRMAARLHADPELGFEEHRTSEFGCEVHRNIGNTGASFFFPVRT